MKWCICLRVCWCISCHCQVPMRVVFQAISLHEKFALGRYQFVTSFLQVCVSADSIYLSTWYVWLSMFFVPCVLCTFMCELPSPLLEKRMKPFLCIGLHGSVMILCTFNGGCAICGNPSVKSSLFWSQGQLYGMILKEPGLEGFAGSWR